MLHVGATLVIVSAHKECPPQRTLLNLSMFNITQTLQTCRNLGISSSKFTHGSTQPAWKRVKAHCPCSAIRSHNTAASPGMKLCIQNWIGCHFLHILCQLPHACKFVAFDDGVRRDEVQYVGSPEVDWHRAGIQCIKELLCHIALCSRVLDGQHKLVV